MAKKSFEKALTDLEHIVGRLESADLTLDEALALFEEGIRLSRFCSEKLSEAEKKVALLVSDADGQPSLQPLIDDDTGAA
jgi:exodeoxyribonuclease VII small subunit